MRYNNAMTDSPRGIACHHIACNRRVERARGRVGMAYGLRPTEVQVYNRQHLFVESGISAGKQPAEKEEDAAYYSVGHTVSRLLRPRVKIGIGCRHTQMGQVTGGNVDYPCPTLSRSQSRSCPPRILLQGSRRADPSRIPLTRGTKITRIHHLSNRVFLSSTRSDPPDPRRGS